MKEELLKRKRKLRRTVRTRSKLLLSNKPRLNVARSNKYIFAQLIDDAKGKTIVAVNEKEVAGDKMTKVQIAEEVGKIIAKKAVEKKIKDVVFDKGGYRYHGRVKAVADGARKEGLNF